jgi:hypothetical protein
MREQSMGVSYDVDVVTPEKQNKKKKPMIPAGLEVEVSQVEVLVLVSDSIVARVDLGECGDGRLGMLRCNEEGGLVES